MNNDIIKPFIFPYNEILKTKLNNGSLLNIIDCDFDTSIFCLLVNCGSYNEVITENKITNGLAHLIEHIIFTNNNLVDSLTNNTCNYNAATSDNKTTFYFECLNKDLLNYIDLTFDIFLNIDNQFTRKIIKSQIQAITNENIKNFSIDILKVLNIIKDVSENKLFSRDNCGSNKTLDIPYIIDFAKLFFITYYIPANIRFVIFTNTKINNLRDIENKFKYFSNFYSEDFIKIKLASSNNIYKINKQITNKLLIDKPFIKTNKTVLFYNNKKNEIFLFFNCKTVHHEYINFVYWLFNRQDKNSLKETLKKYFNVINFEFNSNFIFNTDKYKHYICFINIVVPFSSLNNLNNILEVVFSFIEEVQQLDNEIFIEMINYYKTVKYLECLYFNNFSSHSLDIITDTIYTNTEIDFYTDNILLDNFSINFNYQIKELKNLFKQLNNDCLTFINLNEKETPKHNTNREIRLINNFKIDYLLNNSNFTYTKKYNFVKEHFILSDIMKKEFNRLILLSEKNKSKNIIIKQKNNDIVKLFSQHHTINKINIDIGFSDFLSFHISSAVNFQFTYLQNLDIKYQIINNILIFEYICNKLTEKYNFLNSTDFTLFYKINKIDYNIKIFIHCLSDYYFSVFTDLLTNIRYFVNLSFDKKDVNKEFNKNYEKVKYKINNILDNSKFEDKYFINELFNEQYINLSDIVNTLNYLQFNKLDYQYNKLCFKNIEISAIINNENKDDKITMFLNQISLLSENLLCKYENKIDINNYKKISDFKDIKIVCKNKDNKTIIKTGLLNNLFNFNNKIIKESENYLFSFDILIPIDNIYKDTFITETIKNLIYNNYFNIFRTDKKYSYTVYIENQIVNNNINVFKLFMIINNNLVNDSFIFKVYKEIQEFLYNEYKNIVKNIRGLLNKQKISYLTEYKKTYDNNLINVINYGKLKQKYKNVITTLEYKNIIDQITIDNVLEYYRMYFIKADIKLFIKSVD